MQHRALNTFAGPFSRLAGLHRSVGAAGLARHLHVVAIQRAHTALEHLASVRSGPDATSGKHELSELTIRSANAASGVHFLSTPWTVLAWVHACLPADKSRWTFVDLGAGKGRAVLSAADRPYAKVVGVEFASELAAAGRDALRQAGHHPRRVDLIEADAAEFELPAGPLAVFLFNPFGPPVLDRVLSRLVDAAQTGGQPVIVAYLNPVHAEVFDRNPACRRQPVPAHLDLAFRTLSPYRLNLYAVEADPLRASGL